MSALMPAGETAAGQCVFGTAKRVGKKTYSATDIIVMKIVTCEDCGAQFAVTHATSLRDAGLADKQAVWLADQLVWDHIQEHKHRGSVPLPACDEMARLSVTRSI